ncbi:MAG: histidine phosphatase family protein [Chloroflexi bacterium]|nr:histidine phosphatase family protein [Chloroflexota bacterium]
MEILLIRHGNPDYANDTLTPKGHDEAARLARFLADTPLDALYQSPLGRACDTCAYTAQAKGMTPVTLEWLREVGIKREELYLWNAPGQLFLGGDTLPGYEDWLEPQGAMPEGREQYLRVAQGMDALLASHGLQKEGYLYRVTAPLPTRIALFAHHGVIVTALSYLLHWPLPLVFVHTRIDPTGLTRLVVQEHEGWAAPKLVTFNSLAHLHY